MSQARADALSLQTESAAAAADFEQLSRVDAVAASFAELADELAGLTARVRAAASRGKKHTVPKASGGSTAAAPAGLALSLETPLLDVCNHFGQDVAKLAAYLRQCAVDVKHPVKSLSGDEAGSGHLIVCS